MRIRRNKKTEILEGDLTPMIDMTFQLIAFFMLIINFSAEQHREIELPDSELVKPPDSPPDFEIVLTLNQDGSVYFNQSNELITDIDLMTTFLNREIGIASRQTIPIPASEIDIIIRSHKETETGLIQDLIAKCQASQLQKFKLRVKERR